MTEQRIFRGRHKSNFSALPNGIWEDQKLSIEAKGTLGYLLSRPPNWRVRVVQLGKKLMIGRDRLYRIINELIEAGYLQRQQERAGGAFKKVDYYVRDNAGVASLSHPEKPYPAEPYPAEPYPVNQEALEKKEDSTKKESYKIISSTKPIPQTPCPNAAVTPVVAKRLGNEKVRRPEHASIIQARLADRLGLGNKEAGWLLLGAMTDRERESLTLQERSGRLTADAIREVALSIRARQNKTDDAA